MLRPIVVLLVMCTAPHVAVAQEDRFSRDSRVEAAVADYEPVDRTHLQQARAELQLASDALTTLLPNRSANGRAWQDYLQWSTVQEELQSPSPSRRAALRRVLAQFQADYPGLEKPQLLAAQDALADYLRVADDLAEPVSPDAVRDRINRLATALDSGSAAHPLDRERDYHWLHTRNIAPQLTEQVGQQHQWENLCLTIGREIITRAIIQPIVETTPVRTRSGEATVVGTAHTEGEARLYPVTNSQQAEFELRARATVNSQTTAYQGPATVFNRGQTVVEGRKRILLDEHGVRTLPAQATAVSNVLQPVGATNKFRSRLLHRLVCRITWKKIAEGQASNEQAAARSVENDFAQGFDEDAEADLSKAHSGFLTSFRHPLVRRRAFPEVFASRTTDDALTLVLKQAAQGQLAADVAPPELVGTPDLALRLHESFVGNLVAALLAGATITETEFNAKIAELQGASSDSEGEKNPIAITFDEFRPVSLDIDQDTVAITIRGKEFGAGGRTYPPMNITLRYALQLNDQGLVATQVGDFEIIPPRLVGNPDGRMSGREVALQRILRNRLERDLQETSVSEAIPLPAPVDGVGTLRYTHVAADNGWLIVQWNREDNSDE